MNKEISDKWKCGCSKKGLKKELVEAEDWEVKKKEKLREILDSEKAPYWYCNGQEGENHRRADYPKPWGSFGTSFIQCPYGCGQMYKKVTEFGDEKKLEHECKPQSSSETLSKSNTAERERERERDNILTYLKSNSIKSIELDNNNLIITYNNGKTETNQAKNQNLSQIKTYLQTQPNKKITQSELIQANQSNKHNYLPWILGGVGVLGLIGIVVYLATRKGENK